MEAVFPSWHMGSFGGANLEVVSALDVFLLLSFGVYFLALVVSGVVAVFARLAGLLRVYRIVRLPCNSLTFMSLRHARVCSIVRPPGNSLTNKSSAAYLRCHCTCRAGVPEQGSFMYA